MVKIDIEDKYLQPIKKAILNNENPYTQVVNVKPTKAFQPTVNDYNQQPINQVTENLKPLINLQQVGENTWQQVKQLGRLAWNLPSAFEVSKPDIKIDQAINQQAQSQVAPMGTGYNSQNYLSLKDSMEQKYDYSLMPENTKKAYENVVDTIFRNEISGKPLAEQKAIIEELYKDKEMPEFVAKKYNTVLSQETEANLRLENAKQNLVAMVNKNVDEMNLIQKKYQGDDSLLTDFTSEVLGTVVKMTPYIAASMIAGPGGFGTVATGYMAGSTVMGTQVFTESLAQALSEGATEQQATQYAMVSALIEAGTEAISGGIPGAPKGLLSSGVQGLITDSFKDKAVSQATQVLMEKAVDVFGEGAEEAIAEYLGSMALAIYREDERTDEELTADMVKSFVMGMVTSGAMQMGEYATIKIVEPLVTEKTLDVQSLPQEQVNEVLNKIALRTGVQATDGQAYVLKDLPRGQKGYIEDNQIVLNQKDVEENGLLLSALPHEMTHALENTKGYRELANFVLSQQTKSLGMSLEELKQAYQEEYQRQFDEGLTTELRIANDEEIARELVANFIRTNIATRPLKDANGDVVTDDNGNIVTYRDYNALIKLSERPKALDSIKKVLRTMLNRSKGTQVEDYFVELDSFIQKALISKQSKSSNDDIQFSILNDYQSKNLSLSSQNGVKIVRESNLTDKEQLLDYSLQKGYGYTEVDDVSQPKYMLSNEQLEFLKNVSKEAYDKEGNIKYWYHGTDANFTTPFKDRPKGDYNFPNETVMFFSDNQNVAETYQSNINPSIRDVSKGIGSIYKGYIKFENPFIVKGKNNNWDSIELVDLSKLFNKEISKQDKQFFDFLVDNEIVEVNKNSIYQESDFSVKIENISNSIQSVLDQLKTSKVGEQNSAYRMISKGLNELNNYKNTLNNLGYAYNEKGVYESLNSFSEVLSNYYIFLDKNIDIMPKENYQELVDSVNRLGFDLRKEGFTLDYNKGTNVDTNTVVKTILASNEIGLTNYDSVLFKGISDIGGLSEPKQKNNTSNVIATLKEGMFKDYTNFNPTKSNDIRFMLDSIKKDDVNLNELSNIKYNDMSILSSLNINDVSNDKEAFWNKVEEVKKNITLTPEQVEPFNRYLTYLSNYVRDYSDLRRDNSGHLTTDAQEQDFNVRDENGRLKVFYVQENGISDKALNYGHFLLNSPLGLDLNQTKEVYLKANLLDANGTELQSLKFDGFDLSEMTNSEVIKALGNQNSIESVYKAIQEQFDINGLDYGDSVMVFNSDQYKVIEQPTIPSETLKLGFAKINEDYVIAQYDKYRNIRNTENIFLSQDEVIQQYGSDIANKILSSATDRQQMINLSENVLSSPNDKVEIGDFSSERDDNNNQLTKTQANYFKDSKVRQNDGTLKVVYHGTKNEFDEFSFETMGKNGLRFGYGFYFTDDVVFASMYADGGIIFSTYLDIKNPVVRGSKNITLENIENIINEINLSDGIELINEFSGFGNPRAYLGKEDLLLINKLTEDSPLDIEETLRIITKHTKYDGAFETSISGIVYIPFFPEQIKSINNPNPTQSRNIKFMIDFKPDTNSVLITKQPTQSEYTEMAKFFDNALGRQGNDIFVQIESPDGRYFDKRYSVSMPSGMIVNEIKKFFDTSKREEFFKESKARDEQGNLAPAYHGTIGDKFTVFDKELLGSGSGDFGFFGEGFYFARDKREARAYGNNLFEVYLDIKKPFNIKSLSETTTKSGYTINNSFAGIYNLVRMNSEWGKLKYNGHTFSQIAKDTKKLLDVIKIELVGTEEDYNGNVNVYEVSYGDKTRELKAMSYVTKEEALNDAVKDILEEKYRYTYLANVILAISEESREGKVKGFSEHLQSLGYDSVIQGESFSETDEIVVFEPNQIKEVSNLNPTSSNDIRYMIEEPEKVRQFAQSTMQGNIGELASQTVESNIANGKFKYQVMADKPTLEEANSSINRKGVDASYQEFMANFNSGLRMDKNEIVKGEILIVKLASEGKIKEFEDVLGAVATLGTEGGQNIQAMHMIKTLSIKGQEATLERVLERMKTNHFKDTGKRLVSKDNTEIEVPKEYKEFFSVAQAKQIQLQEQQKEFQNNQLELEQLQNEIDSYSDSIFNNDDLKAQVNELRDLQRQEDALNLQLERLQKKMELYNNPNITFLKSEVQKTQDTLNKVETELKELRKAQSKFDKLSKELSESTVNIEEVKALNEQVKQVRKAQRLLDKMIAENQAYTSQENINAIMDEVKGKIAEQMPVGKMDKLNAWRYLAMLGNPRTHIRNIVGNSAMMPIVATKNLVAAGLQHFIPSEQRTTALSASKEAKQFAEIDYLEFGKDLMSKGKYSIKGEIREKQRTFKWNWLENTSNFVFDALSAEDLFFKQHYYKSSLARYITAQKLDVNTITEEQINQARLHAIEEANKATFNDASALASALTRIEQNQKSAGNKVASFAMQSLIPFKKTPLNILKRGVEYSPIGLGQNLLFNLNKVKNGQMTSTQFIDGISAGLTGTGIALVGAWLYSVGVLELGGDDDETKRLSYLENALGRQRYSLKFFDQSITIDWLAPSVMPLMVGAELQKSLLEESGESLFDRFTDAAMSIMDPLFEMTMLQGVTDVLQSYSSGGAETAVEVISTMMANYVNQFIPTLSGQIARMIDSTQRSTYAPKDSPSAWLEKVGRSILNKIPMASFLNAPVVNVKGEPITNAENPFIRAFNVFLNPGFIKERTETIYDTEILRLYDVTMDSGVLPRIAPKSFKLDGEEQILDNQEYATFQQTLGQTSYDLLKEYTQTRVYESLDDSDRIKFIEDLYEYSYQKARAEYLEKYDKENTDSGYQKIIQSELKGLQTKDYLVIKSIYDKIKDEGGEVKENFLRTIQSKGYSNSQINTFIETSTTWKVESSEPKLKTSGLKKLK